MSLLTEPFVGLFVPNDMTRTLNSANEALLLFLADGSDSRDKPKLYRLQLSVTEVGTEKLDDSSIQVRAPRILRDLSSQWALAHGSE